MKEAHGSIIIGHVNITPKSFTFYDPIDGQVFRDKIELQNIGKEAVSIRMLKPTSNKVIMKPIDRRRFLSPGLKVAREIVYKAQLDSLLTNCLVPIYINSYQYMLPIIVHVHKAGVRIEPANLNFGIIDTGPTPTRRRLKFCNDGAQPIRFHIDLGANDLNLMCEPMKGVIDGYDCVDIRVDVTILQEGTYATEFWVIAGVPICVEVLVQARYGRMETFTRFSMQSFTFLHFPITYFGLKTSKAILVKNSSSLEAIFCITGEKKLKVFHLDEASKIDTDYRQFQVEPIEGRMFGNDVRVFTFSFRPEQRFLKKHENYFLVMVRINKVFCRDLNADDYDDDVFGISRAPSFTMSRMSLRSLDVESHKLASEELAIKPVMMAANTEDLDKDLHVLLYAVAEMPKVSVWPDELVLRNLDLKVSIRRVLRLTNHSRHLPILFLHDKIAFVEVVPHRGTINPRESVELTVTVTPQSYDIINTAVRFDLLYYDQPRRGEAPKKVGELNVPLMIHERVITAPIKRMPDESMYLDGWSPAKQKYHDQQIANKVMSAPSRPLRRHWRSAKLCRPMYGAMTGIYGRHDEFDFVPKNLTDKEMAKTYYRRFMKRTLGSSDLELVCRQHVKCNRTPLNKTDDEKVVARCGTFIPLTPLQLFKIHITPRNRYIDNIVPRSNITHTTHLENKSGCSLRVYLKPQKKQYYTFPQGQRFVVEANSAIDVTFLIYAHLSGLQSYKLDVIVNESHVFETVVTVNIARIELIIQPVELSFTPKERAIQFVTFKNELNENVSFEWLIQSDDFRVEPVDGVVLPGNCLVCLVELRAHEVSLFGVYELLVKVGGKYQTFRIKVDRSNLKFTVPEWIHFGRIPVGIGFTRNLAIQNNNNHTVAYRCIKTNFNSEIGIEPEQGVMKPNEIHFIRVRMRMRAQHSFEFQLKVCFDEMNVFNVQIEGNSVFPIMEVVDEHLRFRKIAASGFDINCFTLRNRGIVPATIQFAVEKLSELYISDHESSNYFMQNCQQEIKPSEQRCFFLHYYPSFPEIKWFHLPMSVNGVTNWRKKDLNALVPRLRIYTSTYQHKILIETWSYFFHFYEHDQANTVDEHLVTMSNATYIPLKLCMRLDNLQDPFELYHVSGGIITKYDYSIVVELGPQIPSVTFKVKFKPKEYGRYELRLPIFVKDDFNEDVHNYLYFNGVFYQPAFIFPEEVIHFGYVPLDLKFVKLIRIEIKYHHPDCHLMLDCDNVNISITYDIDNDTHEKGEFRMIKIMYYSVSGNILDHYLTVECTCGGYEQVRLVGGAENAYLSIYNCAEYLRYFYNVDVYDRGKDDSLTVPLSIEHHASSDDIIGSSCSRSQMSITGRDTNEYIYDSNFPYFPSGGDDYERFFNRTIEVVEDWMCNLAFYGARHYRIPDGFARHHFTSVTKGSMRKHIVIPYYTLFFNLCSVKFDMIDLFCENEETAYLVIYQFYVEILDILQTLGAMVNHIKPESLFEYDTYVFYMTKHHSKRPVLTDDRFYLWSKQSWLHLILQTYKVFVLKRLIRTSHYESGQYSVVKTIRSLHSLLESNFSFSELQFIINWANTDFNLVRNKFNEAGFINRKELPARTLKFFNKPFADGIVLAGVTLTYCPYLVEHFYTMYLPPKTAQQYFYNAYLLLRAWELMNMGIHATPKDLVDSNPVLVIFVLTHLYDFMTHLKPRKEIFLRAELSRMCEVDLYIPNDTRYLIQYDLSIFNDKHQLFRVGGNNQLVINPNHAGRIKIFYRARFMRSHKAVLVLVEKGDSERPMHGRTYTLTGVTMLTQPYLNLMVKTEVYSVCYRDLQFRAPYREDCEYEMFFTYDKPENVKTLNLVSAKSLISSCTLSRIQIDTPHFVVKRREIWKRLRMCSITLNPLDMWIFGRHPEMGDFYVRLSVDVHARKQAMPVFLEVEPTFLTSTCTCRSRQKLDRNCPRIQRIRIPCKNEHLWQAMFKYLFKTREDDEQEFWRSYKDSPIGLHVLKRLLFDHQQFITEDMSYIFDHSFHFKVENCSPEVTLEKKVQIENTLAIEQSATLVVHINTLKSRFHFELANYKERRFYRVYISVNENKRYK